MGITAEQTGQLRQEREQLVGAVDELTVAIRDLIEFLKSQELRDMNRRAQRLACKSAYKV